MHHFDNINNNKHKQQHICYWPVQETGRELFIQEYRIKNVERPT